MHEIAAYEDAVRLCRLPAPVLGEEVHVLRMPDGAVFCGPKKPLWIKTLTASRPYGRIEPVLLREALEAGGEKTPRGSSRSSG